MIANASRFDFLNYRQLQTNLTPQKLSEAANRRLRDMRCNDRGAVSWREACVIGALEGTAMHQRYLGGLHRPIGLLFGEGKDFQELPRARNGLIPYVLDAAETFAICAVRPQIIRLMHPWTQKVFKFWAAEQADLAYRDPEIVAKGLPLLTVALAASSIALCSQALLQTPRVLSENYSVAIKILLAAPAALVGALIGGMYYRFLRPPDKNQIDLGLRGARNEETLSLEPLGHVPAKHYFLSGDGFGFDLRELSRFVGTRQAYINPYHNSAFSNDDIAKLQEQAPDLFFPSLIEGSKKPAISVPLNFFEHNQRFLHDASRALRASSSAGASLPNEGIDALLRLSQRQQTPIYQRQVQEFLTFSFRQPYEMALAAAREDTDASFVLGQLLSDTLISQAAASLKKSYQDIMAILRSSNESEALAQSPAQTQRLESMRTATSMMRSFVDATIPYWEDAMISRHPWVARFIVSDGLFENSTMLEPIDLNLPSL